MNYRGDELPEQIDRIAESIGKLFDVAEAQSELAASTLKSAKELSEMAEVLTEIDAPFSF
jgi:methyl-accepting chemotaxis protein